MQNLKDDVVYAGFFARLMAYTIDTFLVSAALFFPRLFVWILGLVYPGLLLTRSVVFRFSVWDVALYLLGAAYFVVATYMTGYTLGKRLMGIRVVSEQGGLTFLNVCYRETVGRYLSSIIIFVGYLLVGLDPQKRGLHDMLCDTRVVYAGVVKEKKPSGAGVFPPANGPVFYGAQEKAEGEERENDAEWR